MVNTGKSLLFTFFILCTINNIYAQDRFIDPSIHTQAYYDSVRAAVNDTSMERYVIQAYRLKPDEKITIDGKLTESAWSNAEHKSGFLEKSPYPLLPLVEETEFAILYDDNNLYIGVWSWDDEPDKIPRQLNPRGKSSPNNIQIFLDTYHDHRTGYKFNISPTGVQGDELRYDDFKRDQNWNGVWHSAAQIDGKGWYCEVKIPFFNLRFPDKKEHTWGFNIMRNISKNGSRGQWKPHLPEWDLNTRMSKNGHIEGIHDINAGRNFEVRPYLLGGTSQYAPDSPNKQVNVGLDVRYSPTNNITADIAVNPDFAQVDADVTEINLTRFPTRFKELRPFFTERTNIFNTPLELFYSRRIGAKGDILGGAKITGKTQGGYEFGALAAYTGTSAFSQSSAANLDPEKASFGVFRIKKDLFSSSSFGLLGATKEDGQKYNRILGLDGSFVMSQQYLLDVQTAVSMTADINKNNKAVYGLLTRTGDAFGFTANVNYVQPFFDINRVGYLKKETDRGLNNLSTNWRISPRLNKHNIQLLALYIKMGRSTDIYTDRYLNTWMNDNTSITPHSAFGTPSYSDDAYIFSGGHREFDNWNHRELFSITFMNNAELAVGYSKFKKSEVTGSFTGDSLQFSYASTPMNKGARFPHSIAYTTGTFYNFNKKYVGKLKNLQLTLDGRLNSRILTSLEAEASHTFAPSSEKDGEYYRFSSYTTLMFNKDFYLRLQLQGNFNTTYYDGKEKKNKYLISALLSWEYLPGSFFYVAYNEGRRDEDSPFRSKYLYFNDRTLLLKWSYRFNI